MPAISNSFLNFSSSFIHIYIMLCLIRVISLNDNCPFKINCIESNYGNCDSDRVKRILIQHCIVGVGVGALHTFVVSHIVWFFFRRATLTIKNEKQEGIMRIRRKRMRDDMTHTAIVKQSIVLRCNNSTSIQVWIYVIYSQSIRPILNGLGGFVIHNSNKFVW